MELFQMINARKIKYVLDANVIISGHELHYAEKNFPSLWKKLENLLANQEAFIPREVYDEISMKNDKASQWMKTALKTRPAGNYSQELINMIAQLQKDYPKLDEKPPRADYHVIAWAKIEEAAEVTYESQKKLHTRIPSVCRSEGVICLTPMKMITQEGWKF